MQLIFIQFERISCSAKKDVFLRDYVEKRKVVILRGCIEKWAAKTWTIEGELKHCSTGKCLHMALGR